jgi:hypothetical protein
MTVSLPLFFFISLPPFDFCTGWSGPAIVEQGFYIPSLFFGSRRLCGSVWEYDGAKLHLPFFLSGSQIIFHGCIIVQSTRSTHPTGFKFI